MEYTYNWVDLQPPQCTQRTRVVTTSYFIIPSKTLHSNYQRSNQKFDKSNKVPSKSIGLTCAFHLLVQWLEKGSKHIVPKHDLPKEMDKHVTFKQIQV